jgi:hypothetical protein
MTRKFFRIEPVTESQPSHNTPDKKFWGRAFRANAAHYFAPLDGRKNVHGTRFPQLPLVLVIQSPSAAVPRRKLPKAILSCIRKNSHHANCIEAAIRYLTGLRRHNYRQEPSRAHSGRVRRISSMCSLQRSMSSSPGVGMSVLSS